MARIALGRASGLQADHSQGRALCPSSVLRAPSLRDVVSDCAFVVKGYSKRRWEDPSSNGDIWHLIGQALGSAPPINRKVKAHSTLEDLCIGFISYLNFYGNAIAGGLAGRGAEEFAVAATDAANVGLTDQLARQVQRRIFAANRAALVREQAQREPMPPRSKRPPPEAPDAKVARRRPAASHTFATAGSGWRCTSCFRFFSRATFLARTQEHCTGLFVSIPRGRPVIGTAPPRPTSSRPAPAEEPTPSPRQPAEVEP